MQLGQVFAVRDGWAALGTTDERDLVSWRSADGVHWRFVQRLARSNFAYASAVVRRGDDLVAVGTDAEHPALWVSHDEGASWQRKRSAAFGPAGNVLGATVAGDTVVMVGRRGVAPAVWTTSDLVHVVSAHVPRVRALRSWIYGVTASGGGLVAVGMIGERPAVWTTHDGGESWAGRTVGGEPAGGPLTGIVALRGRGLVAPGEVWRRDVDKQVGFVWTGDAAGGSWRVVPRDTGAFGDGQSTRVDALVPFRGAALMFGHSEDRADPNFCYDDVHTCDRYGAVLWLSTDGKTWARVRVDGTHADERYTALASGPSGLLLVGQRFDPATSSTRSRVWRWTGPRDGLPESVVDPTPRFDTPQHELVERYDARLDTGRTYRFPVPIGGGCSGKLDFNATNWKAQPAWGEPPYPSSWPVRHEEVSDGPTEFLYGTVRLVDPRHLEVGIEDGPVLRTYVPTTQRGPYCA